MIQSNITLPSIEPTFPIEIMALILSAYFSQKDLYVLDGQFSSLPSICKLCSYRSLATLNTTTHTIARKSYFKSIVVGKQEEMRGFIRECNFGEMGIFVRELDASLRTYRGSESVEDRMNGLSVTHVETRELESINSADRDRSLLLELMKSLHRLETLDIDIGFFHSLKTTLFPASLTKLTLRNSDPLQTLEIIQVLPNLIDLTLRLVLDWYLPTDCEKTANCKLESFELSITGWGVTSLHSINSILANSSNSLRNLTLRNKSSKSVLEFLPIGHALIDRFAPRLHSLTIKDAPAKGMRYKDEVPLEWFPNSIPSMPQLDHLHLCGISYSLGLFNNLKSNNLKTLCIEDFDSNDPINLMECLKESKYMDKLKFLNLVDHKMWSEEEREVIKEWCIGREVTLQGAWTLRRLSNCW